MVLHCSCGRLSRSRQSGFGGTRTQVPDRIDTDIRSLTDKLPPHIREPLANREDIEELLEIVLDLGRRPEARFAAETLALDSREVTEEDLQYVLDRIGTFGDDNRAGIERSLHRISAIRNRRGKIIGLTLRIGRAVYGTIRIIEDLILTGKSVLLLGKPGVGKTTMLREVARVLADDAHRRVIVVDTSNEIAGDGDVPHRGIGGARRMQVATPALQHAVMIEAVENHMPEVIIIDEIGTEMDANAARTIAERGVQLVGTAHGNTLENLIANPTLSDLVGGVHTVTLGDDEARRRRTQKTVLERRAPPTFDILVEIQGWNRLAVHPDVAEVVDHILRGFKANPETRAIDSAGNLQKIEPEPPAPRTNGRREKIADAEVVFDEPEFEAVAPQPVTNILPYGVNKGKLQQAVRSTRANVELVAEIEKADLLLTTKNFYRRKTQALQAAEQHGKPVYVLRRNTLPQIEQFVKAIKRRHESGGADGSFGRAMREAEDAVTRVGRGEPQVELTPQGSYIRRLQHKIADKYGLDSSSTGAEAKRHVIIFRR